MRMPIRSNRRGIAAAPDAVRRLARALPHTLLDAGGPLVLLLIIGVPLLLVAIVVGLVVLASVLIARERRWRKAQRDTPSDTIDITPPRDEP